MSILGCIGILIFAAADDVTVRVELYPPVIPFHRQATFSIIVEAPEDVSIRMPDMVDQFGGLGVYGTPGYTSEPIGGGRRRITESYTLDAIFAEEYFIEPVEVMWGDDHSVVVSSPSLRVRDLTEEELEEAMIFDASLADPDLSTNYFKLWQTWAVLGVVLVLAASGLIMWLRRNPKEIAAPPAKKAWELAYERLRALDERKLPQSRKVGRYYVDLSAILRYYIEDRFRVHAPGQTTPEFLEEIQGGDILSHEQEGRLGAFLRHSDMVKFAQYEPTQNEMDQSFTLVLEFVDETVPHVEPVGEEAAA